MAYNNDYAFKKSTLNGNNSEFSVDDRKLYIEIQI